MHRHSLRQTYFKFLPTPTRGHTSKSSTVCSLLSKNDVIPIYSCVYSGSKFAYDLAGSSRLLPRPCRLFLAVYLSGVQRESVSIDLFLFLHRQSLHRLDVNSSYQLDGSAYTNADPAIQMKNVSLVMAKGSSPRHALSAIRKLRAASYTVHILESPRSAVVPLRLIRELHVRNLGLSP
jgi:hypothetical protein